MRSLFFAALLGLIALVASAADVTGKWTAAIPGRQGATNATTFVFKVDGDKLTGSMESERGGKVDIAEGKADGDKVSFTVTRNFNGNDIKLAFKGTVAGSEIKFTRTVEGMDNAAPAEFTAKKSN